MRAKVQRWRATRKWMEFDERMKAAREKRQQYMKTFEEKHKIPHDLPGYLKRLLYEKQRLKDLPEKKKAQLVAGLQEYMKAQMETLETLKRIDPFWYYEPNTGTPTDEGMDLLARYIKTEDIPSKFDSAVDIHASKASVIGVAGANQSSKSTVGTINDLIMASRAVPRALAGIAEHRIPTKKNNRIRVTCEDYTNGILNHNLPAMQRWVPKDYLIEKDWYKSWSDKRNTLTLVHPDEKQICATIEFMSNKQPVGTFQGPPVDRCRYDEEPRQDIYQENLLRFTTAERLNIELDMTPTKGLSWVYDELYKEGRTAGGESIEWFKLVAVCNRFANLRNLDEIYSQIGDYDALRMRALGEFVSLSGLVYGKYFKRLEHVIKPEALGLEKGEYLACNCPARLVGSDHHSGGCRYIQYLCFLGVDPHEVKASTALVLALDRNGNHYVDTCYREEKTMPEVAKDINALLQGRRYAFGKCDPHADSDKTAYDNRNIWRMLTTGPNRIPKLRKGDAYRGSRLAGVDIIKALLMPHAITGKPQLYIIDRPENELLIQSFRTLQREAYRDEFAKGEKDEIMEGKHDHHACLRYILQTKLHWTPHDLPLMREMENVISAGF